MGLGLISTGDTYKNKALSGFVRESEAQAEIDRANKQLAAQKKSQQMTMTGTGAVAGAMAGAAMGAEEGSMAGPYGALAGAAIGFLFSELY